METLFDWSDIAEPHIADGHRNEDGTVDWRSRCLHLARAADALQLACVASPPNPNWLGPADQINDAGNLVYYHIEQLRADVLRERETEDVFSYFSIPEASEIERIAPALVRMLSGIRSDNRRATIVRALADAIQDSAAEVGEDASTQAEALRAVCRNWDRDHE
jgi:hypothetical protein